MATYSSLKYPVAAASSSTTTYADMDALIAATGMSAGDQALVSALNKVFMYTGSAWYLVATMTNDSPTAITGVDAAISLAIDGTATVITAVSTDPEGFPLTWSYAVTTGSLGSTATVSQADNVFTITPSSTSADAGSFSITFSVTDGATGAVNAVSAFTLSFFVTDSRYTALSVKATAAGSNQTFSDASSNNTTLTTYAAPTASTFSPYRHGGYAPTFGQANGSSLKVNGSTGVSMGAGDYTIECWINITKSGTQTLFGNTAHRIILINGIFYDWASNGTQTAFAIGGTNWSYTDNMYRWVHLAITRTSGVVKAWIDGVGSSNTVSDTSTWSMSRIGAKADASGEVFNGQMKDIRLVVGTAVYSSDFTPPSEPLTAISGTQLLIGSLPYLKDQSTNNYSITPYGSKVTVEPASTFDNGAYSKANHGASTFFGTANGGAVIPASGIPVGAGDYTIEMWINATKSGTQTLIKNASGHQLLLISGTFYDWASNGTQTQWAIDGTAYTYTEDGTSQHRGQNAWVHLAVTRTSGVVKAWINGIGSSNTVNDTTNWSLTRIGSTADASSENFEGSMCDLRLVVGTAVYSSDFTPPTAPLTAISGTAFLLNPEISISDLSQSSSITCVGNAATSTTQVKFAGTKSIAFDGTGDYLALSSAAMNIPSSTEFTIEGWVYFTGIGSYEMLFGGTGTTPYIGLQGGVNLEIILSSNTFFPWSPNNNIWYYITVVRNSSNIIKLWIDGAEVTATSGSTNSNALPLVNIGRAGGYPQHDFQGYMQDVRVTKGLVRYTANFTPPTAELEG